MPCTGYQPGGGWQGSVALKVKTGHLDLRRNNRLADSRHSQSNPKWENRLLQCKTYVEKTRAVEVASN